MPQRNRFRILPTLALTAALALLPALAEVARAAPLRDDGPRLASSTDGGWAGAWRALVRVSGKEGPSIDPNGGGSHGAARVVPPGPGGLGGWLWNWLINVWANNGMSIDPNGGGSQPPGGQAPTGGSSLQGATEGPAAQ